MYSPIQHTSTHSLHMVNNTQRTPHNDGCSNVDLNSPLDVSGSLDNNDNDQYSLSSTISHSSYNSRADNSLIFERLVQDPLTDIHPPSLPRNRNITTETFIPASLDATTKLIKDEEFVIEEPVQFGFSSRRSSLANLEAALGPSRRTSVMNTPRALSRSNTNSSFSNLTQQLQNASKQQQNPQHNYQLPQAQTISRSSSQLSNLQPITTSAPFSSTNNRTSNSPVINDKNFCSYADIIAQDDHESRFAIRRPSLSASFSGIKLDRANSNSSTLNATLNSPRSPAAPNTSNSRAGSFSTTRFRQNTGFNSTFNSSSFGGATAANERSNAVSSPMNNLNNHSMTSFNSAIDDDTELFMNTPKKQGFSGRSISGYPSKPNFTTNSTTNFEDLLKQKLSISPQLSKQES